MSSDIFNEAMDFSLRKEILALPGPLAEESNREYWAWGMAEPFWWIDGLSTVCTHIYIYIYICMWCSTYWTINGLCDHLLCTFEWSSLYCIMCRVPTVAADLISKRGIAGMIVEHAEFKKSGDHVAPGNGGWDDPQPTESKNENILGHARTVPGVQIRPQSRLKLKYGFLSGKITYA